MKVGVLTGSGTYSLAGLTGGTARAVSTQWGPVDVRTGLLAGVEVLHIARHGDGHERLSSQVNHRANVSALRELGAEGVIAVTVCGALDPDVELGSLIVFDDLHFPSNRLPDGSLCTFYDRPGMPGRGHWIFEGPFSRQLREALLTGAREAGPPARDGGCYGYVDGPRFNTRSEIAALAAAGVTAVSQTAGPEAVLCGEAGLPYGLVGYATDYANGVTSEPTPVERLQELMGASRGAFEALIQAALPRLAGSSLVRTGVHLGWD